MVKGVLNWELERKVCELTSMKVYKNSGNYANDLKGVHDPRQNPFE